MSEAELTGMTEAMAREGELGSGCAMYGQSPLGKPYVANGAAPQALPEKSAKKLQSVCPSVYAANGGPQGLWCCDPSQVDLLATKLALLHEVVLGCPACDHNFKHLWCFTRTWIVENQFSFNIEGLLDSIIHFWMEFQSLIFPCLQLGTR